MSCLRRKQVAYLLAGHTPCWQSKLQVTRTSVPVIRQKDNQQLGVKSHGQSSTGSYPKSARLALNQGLANMHAPLFTLPHRMLLLTQSRAQHPPPPHTHLTAAHTTGSSSLHTLAQAQATSDSSKGYTVQNRTEALQSSVCMSRASVAAQQQQHHTRP
jgi:hypothetical protein